MNKIKNIFSLKTLVLSSPWLMLVIGIALYVLVYGGVFESYPICKEIATKAADVLVIGVILGYFTNIAKIFGIFKQDLRDIVYLEEHLEKRNDLEKLWDTISKQMFANKFPVIHSEFLNAIKEYFPGNEVSYYNNYNAFTKVEWHDRENHIIKATDTVAFELVAESKDREVTYPLRTWTRVNKGDVYQERITEFSVNGKAQQIEDPEEFENLGDKCCQRVFKMNGSEKYEIRYVREKIYSIDTDYYIGFRAKYIVNGLSVTLSLPEGIEAIFTSRGTQHDYEDGINPDCISRKYRGIIFPRQGYTFALRRII